LYQPNSHKDAWEKAFPSNPYPTDEKRGEGLSWSSVRLRILEWLYKFSATPSLAVQSAQLVEDCLQYYPERFIELWPLDALEAIKERNLTISLISTAPRKDFTLDSQTVQSRLDHLNSSIGRSSISGSDTGSIASQEHTITYVTLPADVLTMIQTSAVAHLPISGSPTPTQVKSTDWSALGESCFPIVFQW
jgi:hypothetical protein